MNRAYLDQTAASRDWFSSCIWTCALPRRGLAAGFVLNPLHGVRHAAISVWHRFFFLVRLQAHPSSSWRSFPSSNRWTDGALLLSEFRHGATFESLSSLESSGAPSATALHTDTDVPSCEASDRRAEETSLSLTPPSPSSSLLLLLFSLSRSVSFLHTRWGAMTAGETAERQQWPTHPQTTVANTNRIPATAECALAFRKLTLLRRVRSATDV